MDHFAGLDVSVKETSGRYFSGLPWPRSAKIDCEQSQQNSLPTR